MPDNVLNGYLEQQFREATDLAAGSDCLELCPIEGRPPQRYIAQFSARGLVRPPQGEVDEYGEFHVGIWMPNDYLRRADTAQALTYLGPSPWPWHPNIRPPFICVHLRPATPLVDLLYTCFELWTWTLYYTGDGGLNPEASGWALSQPEERFPVDRRPLKRRKLGLRVDVTS